MATVEQLNKIKQIIEGADGFSIRTSTPSKIVVDCDKDRQEAKGELQEILKQNGLEFKEQIVAQSSFPATVITGQSINIIYKNKRGGGMQETTLNSSITELFPCIAFLTGIENQDLTTVEKFYAAVLKKNSPDLSCYIRNDNIAGKEFVDKAETSTKFKQKVTGALAVLKFIKEQDKGKPVTGVYWGYRNKPSGVLPNHKGDIFLKFNDNTMLGVSIKSGGAKTQEPKLNTYVNPIMEWFGKKQEFEKMKETAFNQFYKDIPGMPQDFKKVGSKEFYDCLGKYELSNKRDYEKRYDQVLEFMRTNLVSLLSANDAKTKQWLMEVVAGEQEGVPLVVVKAIETTGQFELQEDEDVIKSCVARSRKTGGLKVEKSTSSKQNFDISLTCNLTTTKLSFSIRSNKVGVQHKLGQFLNLAVKFNGAK